MIVYVPAINVAGNAPLVALPPLRATALPKLVPLISNCTVPVGSPLELAAASLTVAVKVTPGCPYTEGLAREVSTTALAA